MSLDSSDPCWRRASSLRERSAAGPCRPGDDFDVEQADFRLERWRDQPPFASDDDFERRLAQDGTTETDLYCLLGESDAALAARFPRPPEWTDGLTLIPIRETEPTASTEGTFLGTFFHPWLQAARARVRAEIAELEQSVEHQPYDPTTIEPLLFAPVPRQLAEFASRTLVLEINVARLEGRLHGETAEERQRSFFQQLQTPEATLELLSEYPVLARQLVNHLDQWQRVSLEFLRHLCADWPRLQAHFDLDPSARLRAVREAGDRHRNGRAVRVLEFSSGQKLVYKPRHLAVEVHFQELLHWLNERGDHCPLRPQHILDCGDHGWVEFLGQADCQDEAGLRRFYERQGAYLALFYALKATDFHYGNIIAMGEHPMPVDLEALFHADAADPDAESTAEVDYLAGDLLRGSVVRVGLLPQRLWSRQGYAGIDLSGLSARPGQLSPQKAIRFEGVGTDEVHVVKDFARLGGAENRARWNGEDVDPLAYTDELMSGFVKVYRTLLAHRGELLAQDGPLAPFAEGEVRVIARATRNYSLLLRECTHPDALRDGLDRDQLLDRLWASVPVRPALERLIPAERSDLWRGDIPIFFTRPGSRHVWTSDGERLDDFFQRPSLELVREQLQALSEDDLAQQQWFIRASCALLEPVGQGHDGRSWGQLQPAAQRPSRDAFLAAARRIGERLRQWAVRGSSQEVSWVGVTALKSHQWNLSPLSVDLYSGVPGVALFLAYLGTLTHDAEATRLARGALATARQHMERMREIRGPIGAFSGWGGPIYLLSHLGALWREPELLDLAADLAAQVPEQLDGDGKLDVIGGAAGAIGCLLSLYAVHPVPQVLLAARQCGDHLLAKAESTPEGRCWRGEDMLGQPLSGFGHGAAGIAWALYRLAAATGESRFREGAEAALSYERSLFVPEVGNWRDLRSSADIAAAEGPEPPRREAATESSDEEAPRFMHAWCHGAPGIGLGRLDMHATDPQPALEAEVRAAVETTRQKGFGRNHSLCHGDLGNLDLLLQAGRQLDDAALEDEAYRLAGALLQRIDEHGWICGVPLEVETPGLMTGIAGIGYQLLRLADPERVPSVLVLAAPQVQSEGSS